MSLNLTQRPTGYCFLNKVTELVMTASGSVTMTLVDPNAGPDVIFTGRYHPDFGGQIRIDLTDLVRDLVKSTVPTGSSDYEQTGFMRELQYKIEEDDGGTATGTFTVINAACNTGDTVELWAERHFLTNQNTQKRTNQEAPEWLTWLDLDGDYELVARFYPKAGGNRDVTVKTDTATGCFTANVGYSRLIRMVAMVASQLKGYYDLILTDGNQAELCRQRYLFEERSGREHYYCMVNALGGVDTVIADGENVLRPDMTFNYGRFGRNYVAVDDTDNVRQWSQTLQTEWRERNWLWELLARKGEAALYDAKAKAYERIVVVGSDIAMGDSGQLAQASFDYLLCEAAAIIAATEERSREMTQSAADSAEELNDLTTTVVVAFTEGTTEPVSIPAETLFVLFDDADASVKNTPIYYFVNGAQSGSFTPGVDASPYVIRLKVGVSVHFETEGGMASLELKYYPENI